MAIETERYSTNDFKQAISALLPIGLYWEYEAGDPLDNLLAGLATEFKTIHDETKVSLLYQPNNDNVGWKLSDYQRILDEKGAVGIVSDRSMTPNVIYVELAPDQAVGKLMQSLDSYRLPHTIFCTTYRKRHRLYVAMVRRSLQINKHIIRDSE